MPRSGPAVLGLAAPPLAKAESANDYAGTYTATLPERAEILNLHADGTAEITLSDQPKR